MNDNNSTNVNGKSAAMSKRKHQSSYCVDRTLLPRVQQYLDVKPESKTPNIDDVLEYLQDNFGEYKRRKRNVLRLSVTKIMEQIREQGLNSSKERTSEKKHGHDQDRKLSKLENKFLKKRHSLKDTSGTVEEPNEISSESDSSLDEELVEYKDQNRVNNSMRNLYRNQSAKGSGSDIPQSPSNNNECLTWTIDKNPECVKLPHTACNVQPDASNANGRAADDLRIELDEIETRATNLRTNVINDPRSNKSDITTGNIETNHNRNNVLNGKVNAQLTVISEDGDESLPNSRPATPSGKVAAKRSSKFDKAPAKKVKRFETTESTVSLKDVGGCESTLQEVGKLLLHLKHPEVFQQLGIKPPRGFLLHGPPGCGKTLLAHAIAGEMSVPFFRVAATELVSGISGDSEARIRKLFAEALEVAPAIVFVDEIDSIATKRDSASKEMERRVVTQMLTCMDDLANQEEQVLIIGATNQLDSIDPALRRAGRFDREIAMGIPDRTARQRILRVICRDLKLSSDFNFECVASLTPGFVGADLQALVREAAMCAVDRAIPLPPATNGLDDDLHQSAASMSWLREESPLSTSQLDSLFITVEHFQAALPNVQPSAKREGFATVPDVTWADVGALDGVREELSMAIMAPVQRPLEFEALGLTTPPGILLAGPPGCGKTLLAKAIANEAGINFISVKGPELLNMYVGESERAVRQVFERARNSSPCVIFFDEIDALCPRRSSHGDSNASARVVNQLLTEMDGVTARKQVFVLGATNRPDMLDAAILRPGRLDKLLYVGLPSSSERVLILRALTRDRVRPPIAADVDLAAVAAHERCEGFSGADLAALVREAAVAALKDSMLGTSSIIPKIPMEVSTAHTAVTPPFIEVNAEHFERAFDKVKPSVSEKDRLQYDELRKRTMNTK